MPYITRALTAADAPAVAALQALSAAELTRTGQHPVPLQGWDDEKARRWIGRGQLAGGVFDDAQPGTPLVLAWFGSIGEYRGEKAVLVEWRFRTVGMRERDARLASAYGTRDYVLPEMQARGCLWLFGRTSPLLEQVDKRTFTAMGVTATPAEDTRFEEWAVSRNDLATATSALIRAG